MQAAIPNTQAPIPNTQAPIPSAGDDQSEPTLSADSSLMLLSNQLLLKLRLEPREPRLQAPAPPPSRHAATGAGARPLAPELAATPALAAIPELAPALSLATFDAQVAQQLPGAGVSWENSPEWPREKRTWPVVAIVVAVVIACLATLALWGDSGNHEGALPKKELPMVAHTSVPPIPRVLPAATSQTAVLEAPVPATTGLVGPQVAASNTTEARLTAGELLAPKKPEVKRAQKTGRSRRSQAARRRIIPVERYTSPRQRRSPRLTS